MATVFDRLIGRLRCPSCLHCGLLGQVGSTMTCRSCNASFPLPTPNAAFLYNQHEIVDTKKKEIQAWWGDLCKQWYSSADETLEESAMPKHIASLEDMFVKRKHMAVTEMDVNRIANLEVLEIGSGSGWHSALFAHHGANVTAADITPERVLSSAKKLSMIGLKNGVAIGADAENLPFCDEAFDIVYSNGVLHHTVNTARSIDEVFRVLKKDGTAIIMLYSRHSAHYWTTLVPKGIINRDIFRLPEAEWIGRITEGGPKFGNFQERCRMNFSCPSPS